MKEMMHIAKKDRKKLLMLGVFALLGIGLMLFSSSIGERKDRTASDANAGENDIVSEEDTAAALGALLSEIKGAGAVDVEIYRDSDGFRTMKRFVRLPGKTAVKKPTPGENWFWLTMTMLQC